MIKYAMSVLERYKFWVPFILFINNQKIQYINFIHYFSRPVSPTPPEVKRWWIKRLQKAYACDQFIETGTFFGDTTFSVMKDFNTVHTIELSEELCSKAEKRFSKHENITVHRGDSGKILHKILKQNKTKTLFWLDGHYSEGVTAKGDLNTPIEKELSSVKKYYVPGSVIMIDDARDFIGIGDYPTITRIKNILLSIDRKIQIHIEDDIIIAIPKK